MSFQWRRQRGQTFVLFKHAGWERLVEFMHHCGTKWAVLPLITKIECGVAAIFFALFLVVVFLPRI